MCQYCEEPINEETPQNAYLEGWQACPAYIVDTSRDSHYPSKDGESKWVIAGFSDYMDGAAILFCPFCGRELPQD